MAQSLPAIPWPLAIVPRELREPSGSMGVTTEGAGLAGESGSGRNHPDPPDPRRAEHITQALHLAAGGDRSALDAQLPLVYDELRRIAAQHMANERTGHTLQATAVVHEAYFRLLGQRNLDYRDRGQFFAAA